MTPKSPFEINWPLEWILKRGKTEQEMFRGLKKRFEHIGSKIRHAFSHWYLLSACSRLILRLNINLGPVKVKNRQSLMEKIQNITKNLCFNQNVDIIHNGLNFFLNKFHHCTYLRFLEIYLQCSFYSLLFVQIFQKINCEIQLNKKKSPRLANMTKYLWHDSQTLLYIWLEKMVCIIGRIQFSRRV